MSARSEIKLSEFSGLTTPDPSDRAKLRVSRNTQFCEVGKMRDEYVYTPLTIIFFMIGLGFDLYLLLKYTTAEQLDDTVIPFISQIGIILFMLLGGLVVFVVFVRKVKIQQIGREAGISILLGVGLGLILLLMQGFVSFLRFSVIPQDYFIMFLSVAISEEFLWRFGVQSALKTIINVRVERVIVQDKYEKVEESRGLSTLISSGFAILITSSLFTITHIFVYTETFELVIVFMIGIGLGIGMELTKNVDTAIIAHLILNIFAGYSLIIQYFGGF